MAIINNSPSTCAVSVIVPMYNAEKYIGECLESILNQTLQNFEVILVNDCATDNSRQVAETYLEKFGGRLKIYDNRKNSGVSATRNRGLLLSRGEYVFFMDSDDLLLLNGLEDMYTLAKKYDVDFINCPKMYEMTEDGKTLKVQPITQRKNIVANKEFILDDDLAWRVNGLLKDIFYYGPPRRFLRRDFLIENEIFFPESLRHAEDQSWTHGLLLCAKKILHVSRAWYLIRLTANSLSRNNYDLLHKINIRVISVIDGLGYIDNFLDKIDFFAENPKYRYALLEHYAYRRLSMMLGISFKVPQSEIYAAIKEEFGEKVGKQDVLVAELCSLINDQQKEIRRLNEQLNAK